MNALLTIHHDNVTRATRSVVCTVEQGKYVARLITDRHANNNNKHAQKWLPHAITLTKTTRPLDDPQQLHCPLSGFRNISDIGMLVSFAGV